MIWESSFSGLSDPYDPLGPKDELVEVWDIWKQHHQSSWCWQINKIYVSTTNGLGIIGNLDDKPLFILRGIPLSMFVFMKAWYPGRHLIGIVRAGRWKEFTCVTTRCRNSWPRFFNKDFILPRTRAYLSEIWVQQIWKILNTRNSDLPPIIYFVYADSKSRCWLGTEVGEVRIVEDDWQVDHREKQVTHYYETMKAFGLCHRLKDQKQENVVDWSLQSILRCWFRPRPTRAFKWFCIDSKGRLYFASEAFIRYDPYEERNWKLYWKCRV